MASYIEDINTYTTNILKGFGIYTNSNPLQIENTLTPHAKIINNKTTIWKHSIQKIRMKCQTNLFIYNTIDKFNNLKELSEKIITKLILIQIDLTKNSIQIGATNNLILLDNISNNISSILSENTCQCTIFFSSIIEYSKKINETI